MSILVTGATGNIGSRLVRRLTAAGHRVRAFTRSGDRARFDEGVEVVNGDFKDQESLQRAMQGVTRMFLLSAAADLEQHDANAIDAAKAAGLELVVKQSVTQAPSKASLIPQWHRAGEERLERSGLGYVFLRPASFTSNALGWVGSVKSDGTIYNPFADTALPVVHPDDIADVAAVVITQPGHAGTAYDITGPEALTVDEQAAILSEVLGRPIKTVPVSDEAMRDGMLKAGTPPTYVEARVGLVQMLRNLGRIEPSSAVEDVTWKPPRSFRQWVEENVAAFR